MARPKPVQAEPLLWPEMDDRAAHGWYQFVLGYPPSLVAGLLDRFNATLDTTVLDPFCGTGTTLVECKKRDVPSVGIDANPFSFLVSRAKTNWGLDVDRLGELLATMCNEAGEPSLTGRRARTAARELLPSFREWQAFEEFGLVERKWISPVPLARLLLLKRAIENATDDDDERRFFLLALATVAVKDASNLRFGPEVYCAEEKADADVIGSFQTRVQQMLGDLVTFQGDDASVRTPATVLCADARDASALAAAGPFDLVITSPPYPTEHDYTRATRLEIVLLEMASGNDELRTIKKTMIRSHSKGIYKDDREEEKISSYPRIMKIVEEMKEKVRHKTYGFAKQYPRVISEYFGGMMSHFEALFPALSPGAVCAYVVGQQRTYLQTFTPTALCLSELAADVGFSVEGVETFRVRKGTTGSRREIKEEILILRKA